MSLTMIYSELQIIRFNYAPSLLLPLRINLITPLVVSLQVLPVLEGDHWCLMQTKSAIKAVNWPSAQEMQPVLMAIYQPGLMKYVWSYISHQLKPTVIELGQSETSLHEERERKGRNKRCQRIYKEMTLKSATAECITQFVSLSDSVNIRQASGN